MVESSRIPQAARAFLRAQPVGVVSTIRPHGRARQSVTYFLVDDDRIVVPTEAKRAKARDVERIGWASLCVVGHQAPFPSVTVEGKASIKRHGIARDTARIFALVAGGEGPDLTDDVLAAIDRVILDIAVDRVYGASYLSAS